MHSSDDLDALRRERIAELVEHVIARHRAWCEIIASSFSLQDVNYLYCVAARHRRRHRDVGELVYRACEAKDQGFPLRCRRWPRPSQPYRLAAPEWAAERSGALLRLLGVEGLPYSEEVQVSQWIAVGGDGPARGLDATALAHSIGGGVAVGVRPPPGWRTPWVLVDCDAHDGDWAAAWGRVAGVLGVMGPAAVVTRTRRGYHVLYSLRVRVDLERVRGLEAMLRDAGLPVGAGRIEVYPRASKAIRLPGTRAQVLVDQRTGKRVPGTLRRQDLVSALMRGFKAGRRPIGEICRTTRAAVRRARAQQRIDTWLDGQRAGSGPGTRRPRRRSTSNTPTPAPLGVETVPPGGRGVRDAAVQRVVNDVLDRGLGEDVAVAEVETWCARHGVAGRRLQASLATARRLHRRWQPKHVRRRGENVRSWDAFCALFSSDLAPEVRRLWTALAARATADGVVRFPEPIGGSHLRSLCGDRKVARPGRPCVRARQLVLEEAVAAGVMEMVSRHCAHRRYSRIYRVLVNVFTGVPLRSPRQLCAARAAARYVGAMRQESRARRPATVAMARRRLGDAARDVLAARVAPPTAGGAFQPVGTWPRGPD